MQIVSECEIVSECGTLLQNGAGIHEPQMVIFNFRTTYHRTNGHTTKTVTISAKCTEIMKSYANDEGYWKFGDLVHQLEDLVLLLF